MIARTIAAARAAWWTLVRRDRADQALDDEVRTYVDLLAGEYERSGMAPDAARRRALIDTGGVEQVKELTRDSWVGSAWATASRELRYGLRTLGRAPTFLVVAMATLAIGIGGTTGIFTVINASLLRPLPAAAEPERLVTIERVEKSGRAAEFSYPDFRDLASRTTALTGLAGFNGMSANMEDKAASGSVWVSFVTDEFFSVLGVRPAAGRFFGVNVTEAGRVIVLGHALWQSRFGGSAAVVGSTIKLSDRPYTVIGVAPPGFIGAMTTHRMEAWIPTVIAGRSFMEGDLDITSRRDDRFRLVGRLAPGKTIADAQRDLNAITQRLGATYPSVRGRTIEVVPRTGMTAEEREDVSRIPRLLAAAVALLLLIACGNVASLSLVRAASRRREFATRVALGASRASLVRQVALEAVLVAAGAGVLGVAIGALLVRSATLVRTVVSIRGLVMSLDARVLIVAVAASTITAVLVSVWPAMQVLHLSPADVLKNGGGVVRGAGRAQRTLVATQVAASLVLLAASGIIFRAFHHVLESHDATEPAGISDTRVDFTVPASDTAKKIALYRELTERLASDPSVSGAAIATTLPPFLWVGTGFVFRYGEDPPRSALLDGDRAPGLRPYVIRVSETFFGLMRIPVIRGRGFAAADDGSSEPVVVLSRRLAEVLWPGQNAVGQLLTWPSLSGPARAPLRVVGVVENTRDVNLSTDPPLAIYVPIAQRPSPYPILILRGNGGRTVPLERIREAALVIDPRAKVAYGRALTDRLQDEIRPQQTASAWVGVFALIAMLLATIGLYGVVAQSVLQRMREFAVRSALGATPSGILGLVLRDGLRLTVIGVVIGALASIGSVRMLSALFAGVQTSDVQPAALAATALAIAMLCAAYLPARRAAKLNPADALRSD